MTSNIKKMDMKKITKKAWLFCGWTAAVLMAVLFFVQVSFWGGIVWINSNSGQTFIQNALGMQLEKSGYRVEIGGLSYAFPTRLRVGRISLYQGETQIVKARAVHLNLDIFPLSDKILMIDFEIKELAFQPSEKAQKDPDQAVPGQSVFPIVLKPFDLPDLYFTRFVLSDITVGKLIIKGNKDVVASPKISGDIVFKNKRLVKSDLTYIDQLKVGSNAMPREIKFLAQFNSQKAMLEIEKINIITPLYTVSTKAEAIFRDGGEIKGDVDVHLNTIASLSPLSVLLKAKNTADFSANVALKGQYFEKDIVLASNVSFTAPRLALNNIHLSAPDITAKGNIFYNTTTSLATGKLSGLLDGLTAYQSFVGAGHNLQSTKFDIGINGTAIKIDVASQGYVNKGFNVAVGDIKLDAVLVDQIFTINSLTMRDKEQGTFSGSGTLSLADQSLDFSVKAEQFHAIDGDVANGIIGADIMIAGNPEHYKVSGTIEPEKIEIKLPERFSGGIPQLNIQKKGKPKKRKVSNIAKNIELDLVVDAPRQILVRGWGLDAEFGGKLEIKGSAYDPKFYGDFNALRGRYSEFGKKFKLAKAKMKFSGSVPPSPILDILTETKAGDVIAMVAITGSVLKPEIAFSSKPPLPQDEVVAQILFGEDMEDISPFQAVQLAQTMQRFSGGSLGGGASAFDPVGSLKSAVGLDDLRVETDDQGAATVGAGKYLTEKVYLEFETGSEEDSGNANIQVELTPNITLESEIGQDARGGAGLFWKWDY